MLQVFVVGEVASILLGKQKVRLAETLQTGYMIGELVQSCVVVHHRLFVQAQALSYMCDSIDMKINFNRQFELIDKETTNNNNNELIKSVGGLRIELECLAEGLKRGSEASAAEVGIGQALPHVEVGGIVANDVVEETNGLVRLASLQIDDAETQRGPLAVLDLVNGALEHAECDVLLLLMEETVDELQAAQAQRVTQLVGLLEALERLLIVAQQVLVVLAQIEDGLPLVRTQLDGLDVRLKAQVAYLVCVVAH